MINNVLSQSSFWIVNKHISKKLGSNDAALLLSELIDKSSYFNSTDSLKDGYFYMTSEHIKENLNISYFVQKKCIDVLVKNELIETKLMGVPAKLHFKLLENKILNFLNTGIKENQKLDIEKFETSYNNNKENNNKNNNKESKQPIEKITNFEENSLEGLQEDKLSKSSTNNPTPQISSHRPPNDEIRPPNKIFKAPTLEEAKKYFKEHGYSEESASLAWKYYNSADWHDSRGKKVKNWKQKFQGVWFKPENRNTGQKQNLDQIHREEGETQQSFYNLIRKDENAK